MYKKLPQAPSDKICALKGSTWNDIAQLVEAFSRLTVAPPLMLSMTPTGPVLSLASTGRPLYVLTGNAAQSGTYTMQPLKINPVLDATIAGQFTNAQIGTPSGGTVYGINLAEANKSSGATSQWDLDTTGANEPQIVEALAFYKIAGDGKAQYLISVIQGESC